MPDLGDMVPPGVRLGVVRGISYGLFGKPDRFVPQARELGAELIRVYVYWSQVEPEPGRFAFEAVDAFLDQLDGSEEVWVTVCSSSPWATRQATGFLPPSPAKDLTAYHRFVDRLVRHCAGRVHYWQCDNEPSNVGLTWAGTAAEYVAQLRVMHRAVKQADPGAAVVLGGAPFGLPASLPGSPERQFFDQLLRDGGDAFDLAAGAGGTGGQGQAAAPSPEEAAMARLYEDMAGLPPQLQMFMRGCPPELEAKRDRINRRELVMRNLLALSAGVRRTACWNLAPEIPGYENRLSIMDLLFGKLVLLGYQDGELSARHPSADAFALVARQLAGVEQVTRVPVPERPGLFLFEVRRRDRGPLLVVWDRRDAFDGEDEPPVAFDWPWPAARADAVDALGQAQPAKVVDGRVELAVSLTPVFVAAG
jgi:hypothetical protein